MKAWHKKILPLAMLALFVAVSAEHVFAKDAFGLDGFKSPVEALTKPQKPYRTRFGNQISVYSITNPTMAESPVNAPLRFLIQGGLHGNELLTSEFVAWLATRFAKGDSLLNTLNSGNVEIDFLPYANPDGTIQYTRSNGNKINLNRNFGVLWGLTRENPGSEAFSESESRAIRDLFLKRNYTGAIDVHGYVNWVVLPTAPDDAVKGLPKVSPEKLKAYTQWSNAIRKETKEKLPGYEVKTAGGLGDGGSFEDFAWWSANVPATCLELFSNERYVARSLAARIVDLITPRIFADHENTAGRSDIFLVYENYLHTVFLEAIKIKTGKDPTQQVAAKTP